MCGSCFSDDTVETTTDFSYEYANYVVTIHNVPCLKCRVCGEVYFTDETSGQIEAVADTVKSMLEGNDNGNV